MTGTALPRSNSPGTVPGRDLSDRNDQGGTGRQASRPLVMVCLSPSPSNVRVIRTAAKMAFPESWSGRVMDKENRSPGRSAGSNIPGRQSSSAGPDPGREEASSPGDRPIALYIGSTGTEADQDALLRDNILYAKAAGFEIHTVRSNDIPLAIAEYARRAGVTDLFVGYSPPPFFLQARRAINEQLLSYLPTVDIHIVPDPVSSPYPKAVRSEEGGTAWNIRDLLRVLAIMAAATLLSVWFDQSRYSNANIITIYILAVLIASVVTSSRVYGLLATVLYVLLFNFLFIDPRFTLVVYDSAYLVTYLVTAVAAVITGTVTIRMKNIARVSAENEYQARILLDTVGKLERASGREDVLTVTCEQLVHLLGRAVVFFSPDAVRALSKTGTPEPGRPALEKPHEGTGLRAGKKTGRSSGSSEDLTEVPSDIEVASAPVSSPHFFSAGEKMISPDLASQERAAILWTMENRHHAGAFTSHFPEYRCRYLCLFSGDNRFGVFGIDMDDRPFTEFEKTILLSIVHECTMTLEYERLGQIRKEAEIRAENERLRSGLLRSISHDLRTPLTSISGNASSLRLYEQDLTQEDRNRIYDSMIEDAQWLNVQFENILSMTRLESGHSLQRTVENMEDVIEESLRHIVSHPGHEIVTEPASQLLFAEMDSRLLLQVLINLLNNAVKYTPEGTRIRIRAWKASGPDSIYPGPGLPGDHKIHTERGASASPEPPAPSPPEEEPAPSSPQEDPAGPTEQESEGWIIVEVTDNGPGIPDDDKPHIFELFYAGQHTLADSYRSMGIGLNLCAGIMHAHGGGIAVDDNIPSGAVFRLWLPAYIQ